MKRLQSIPSAFRMIIVIFLLYVIPGFLNAEGTVNSMSSDYWPTNGWRNSTPEKQGMDSGKLADMFEFIKSEGIGIDSVTIIRNGYIVTDAYLEPLFQYGQKHVIHSCTKSIMSALVGIAIDKGFLKGVDERVIDFFSDKQFANMEERKKAITVKHLLTMSHGIRTLDSWLYKWQGLNTMMSSSDWIKYTLDRPMDEMPGKRFDYSNMSSFLLAAIVQKQTNRNALDFAKEHLFEPLGITDVKWPVNPNGIQIGWGEMWMTPHDMAKFGWLYLNNGYWEGKQIVSKQWVKESTQKHTSPMTFRKVIDEDGDLLLRKTIWSWIVHNFFMSISGDYGYQWWLDDSGIYSAFGWGGQYIFVVPDKNLVAVLTGVLKDVHVEKPGVLLKEHIIPAVSTKKELPANPVALKRLRAVTKVTGDKVVYESVTTLPEKAKSISGLTFHLKDNPFRHYVNGPFAYTSFSLSFQPDSKVAYLKQSWGINDTLEYKIGLDNVYRITDTGKKHVAMKGYWRSTDGYYGEKNKFTYSFNEIGGTMRGTVDITFEEKKAIYYLDWVTGGNIKLIAHAE